MKSLNAYNAHRMSIKKKVLLAGVLLLACRVFARIPTPFTNAEYFQSLLDANPALYFLNSLSGSGLSALSIMTLSITPYITASIILQLMSTVIPSLDELQRGMADDRKKYEKINLILAIILAFIEGLGMAIGYGRQGMIAPYTWYSVLCVTVLWTAGTTLAVYIGKIITDHLIGNGVSLILVSNILSSFAGDAYSIYENTMSGQSVAKIILMACVFAGFVFAAFWGVTYVHGCERVIPIHYSGKISRAGSSAGTGKLPIKLCPGTVIPIIFASSVLSVPTLVANLLGKALPTWMNFFNTSYWFQKEQPWYSLGIVLYILMIIGFSFFYANLELNPTDMAEQIKKNGGTISGIRPGKATADYIKKQMHGTLLIGSLFLCVIAIIPFIIGSAFHVSRISFLGTSIIIIVGVILETTKTVSLEMKNHKWKKNTGFLKEVIA